MNPTELLDKVKEFIAAKDLDGAKTFIEENKDKFGEYLEEAKKMLAGLEGGSFIDGAIDKVKGLFGK